MTILFKDIQDSIVISFTPNLVIANGLAIALTCLSLSAVLISLYALLNQPSIPHDSYFIISITLADLFMGIIMIVIESYNGI